MRALFDISTMVRKYSALPIERIRLIQDIADLELPSVRRGIVMIFAAWSGQSVLGLQRLTRFLAARDEAFDFIVVDIEAMTTQEMKQGFGREFYGRGETLWIQDGQVVAFLETYAPDSELLIARYSKQFLG